MLNVSTSAARPSWPTTFEPCLPATSIWLTQSGYFESLAVAVAESQSFRPSARKNPELRWYGLHYLHLNLIQWVLF